jgi:hypothetical protein
MEILYVTSLFSPVFPEEMNKVLEEEVFEA